MRARAIAFATNSRLTSHILTLSQGIRFTMLMVLLSFSACQSTSEKLSGTYETSFANAPSLPEAVRLRLNKDHTVQLHRNYTAPDDMLLQRGSWERSDQDSITVFLVAREGRMFLDTLGLRMNGSQLILKGTGFSREGVLLRKTE